MTFKLMCSLHSALCTVQGSTGNFISGPFESLGQGRWLYDRCGDFTERAHEIKHFAYERVFRACFIPATALLQVMNWFKTCS